VDRLSHLSRTVQLVFIQLECSSPMNRHRNDANPQHGAVNYGQLSLEQCSDSARLERVATILCITQ
jgi:hypothetical protein